MFLEQEGRRELVDTVHPSNFEEDRDFKVLNSFSGLNISVK
jgi:hypothetical protein